MREFMYPLIVFLLALVITLASYGYYCWMHGAMDRVTHITIKWENRQVELYNNLKIVGVELSPSQQKEFENLIKKQHRTIGYK